MNPLLRRLSSSLPFLKRHPSAAEHPHRATGAMMQWARGIRVWVRDDNLEQALMIMQRKMQSSGMERLIKRHADSQRHLKNSEKRVLARKNLQMRIRSQELARKLQSILAKKIRGMAYLHNEPNVIIHRDLKPRNVLLVNSNADHLKVGDFGLSKLIKVQNSHDVYKMTGETGSYRYMAPEVFKHRKYDKKVDVFSFAMILYEMLEGEPPLASYEPYEAAKYVSEGHRPTFRAKGLFPELRELTDQCWAADMNQRPSFIEILKRLEKIKQNLSPDHHWHLFPQ